MFDDGKLLILRQSQMDWIMSRHPIGDQLTKLELDGEPRDWFIQEQMDPAEWKDRPDVLAYLRSETPDG